MKNLKSIAAGLFMAVAVISLSAAPAHALIISIADSTGAFAGTDVVTFDDVNNREWLEITESTSRSFLDVSGQFGAGGDFAGWRHATRADLTSLFTQAGFSPDFTGAPADVAFTSFQQMLGITLNKKGRLDTRGYFDDSLTGSDPVFVGQVHLETQTDLTIRAEISEDSLSINRADSEFGSFLVRDVAVPEPGALAIFSLGLIGLGYIRRRKAITSKGQIQA